jgi:hypothetical protein
MFYDFSSLFDMICSFLGALPQSRLLLMPRVIVVDGECKDVPNVHIETRVEIMKSTDIRRKRILRSS